MGILSGFFGKKSDRDIREIMPDVEKIHKAYEHIKTLSNDALRQKTVEFRAQIQAHVKEEVEEIDRLRQQVADNPEMDSDEKEALWKHVDQLEKRRKEKTEEILQEILPEAFAVIKDTARRFKENETVEVTATEYDRDLAAKMDNVEIRGTSAIYYNQWMAGGNRITWDMVHYNVQLIGGIVLHQGKISEMATGEGKTLVATLPVYLNALPGRGVHIVTVNDYLAKRDSEWMGMLFRFHGLRVDCIDKHEPNSESRRQAYLADVTYGTNNEFGFDYLRDNMATHPDELVQRDHNYAIVDEVDSVLVDDARTPLIISGPTSQGDKQEFDQLKPIVNKLYNAQKALVTKLLADAKQLLSNMEQGDNEKEGFKLLFRAYRGLPKNKALIKFLSEPGIKTGLQKTENFFLQEQQKNMHIIDDELYFVIEEKQNTIDLKEKGIDILTEETGNPDFYILPDIGSAIAEMERADMSQQAKMRRKSEMMRDYAIISERVHTINQLLKAYCLFEIDVDYVVMDNKVKIVDEQTGRILEGRRYSDGLHQAIEAKENVKVEAATQTYATITLQNYFRMYHKLAGMTGTAETEAGEFWDIYKLDVVVIPTNKPVTRDDQQDYVFKTQREKYNAVINTVDDFVKAGRPVLVGTTAVETSELLSRMLQRKNIRHNVLNAKLHQREAQIVAEAGQAGTVTIATNMAGRGTDIKLGPGVKGAGGLAIIGTERHESRRVDRQLRGRAGRQGDPGSSIFFVSLEDNLMRLFGSERIARVMDRIGIKEGEVIQHSMITKSIEKAQKKVEENNFGIRKRLLEYDDVMNNQRTAIYSKRKSALFGDRLSMEIDNMMYDIAESLTNEFQANRDFDGLKLELIRLFGIEAPFSEKEFFELRPAELNDALYLTIIEFYRHKSDALAIAVFPVVKDVFENNAQGYRRIAIPITDGVKTMNIPVDLELAYKTQGRELLRAIEKAVTLSIIDVAWKEHLREMDDLKQSVQNATYEQKDPLLIYKMESFKLFGDLLQRVSKEIISFLMKGGLPSQQGEINIQEARHRRSENRALRTQKEDVEKFGFRTQQEQKTQPVKVEKKVGRNDPCPCGSGKKYKHCHGHDTP
jgi:preprotein translocase subunit SecA